MEISTFRQLLERNAAEFPDTVAFQIREAEGYKTYTFSQVAKIAARLQSKLASLGVKSGERAVIISENRPEWPIAFLAITAMGAAAVPIDAMLRREEIIPLIDDAEPKAVIVCQRLFELFHGTRLAGREIVMEEYDRLPNSPIPHTPYPASDDLASIVYTSGTTGSPKGVMLTHRNILSNVAAVAPLFEIGPADNFLSVLPLHHTFETTGGFLAAFYKGCHITYAESLKSYNLLRNMRETKVTIMCGVPLLYQLFFDGILREAEEKGLGRVFKVLFALSKFFRQFGLNLGKIFFSTVHKQFGGKIRIFVSGGAAIDPQLLENFALMGFTVLQGYGLTESAPILTANNLQANRWGAAGRPVPGVEVKISGEGTGEIIARGPNIMRGYYKRRDLTDEVLINGWLHTGDVGYFDRDGYLFITGRIKDIIVTGSGVNVYPEEIEFWLNKLPSIKEGCILGEKIKAGLRQGMEQVVAVVVVKAGVVEQQARAEIQGLNKNLAEYKRIARVVFSREELPKTRLQKVKRFAVRKELGLE